MNIIKTIWNLPKTVWVLAFVAIAYGTYEPEPVKVVETQEKVVYVDTTPWTKTEAYQRCYAELTIAHKSNGLHDKNRMQSIKIKETMCKAQAGY